MDSFELTKIVAAILAALLLIVGTGTYLELTSHTGYGDKVVGYSLLPEGEDADGGDDAAKVEVADAGATAEPAAAAPKPAGFDAAAIVTAASTASPEAGLKVFRACKACHTNEEGAPNRVGPALWGVVDRDKGSVEGFKYSAKLSE
ncbi:MAG: hypothetical protein AAFO75_10440, partial [Pseudomonadota bacterium]